MYWRRKLSGIEIIAVSLCIHGTWSAGIGGLHNPEKSTHTNCQTLLRGRWIGHKERLYNNQCALTVNKAALWSNESLEVFKEGRTGLWYRNTRGWVRLQGGTWKAKDSCLQLPSWKIGLQQLENNIGDCHNWDNGSVEEESLGLHEVSNIWIWRMSDFWWYHNLS